MATVYIAVRTAQFPTVNDMRCGTPEIIRPHGQIGKDFCSVCAREIWVNPANTDGCVLMCLTCVQEHMQVLFKMAQRIAKVDDATES